MLLQKMFNPIAILKCIVETGKINMIFLLDVRTMTGSKVKLDSPMLLMDITSMLYSTPGSRSLIMAEGTLAG